MLIATSQERVLGSGAAKQPCWEAKGGHVIKGCTVAGTGMGFQDDQDQTMEETLFGWWLFSWWMASMVACHIEQKCSTPGHCWCDVGVSLEFLGQPLQERKKRCECGCIVVGVTVL